MLKTLLFLLFLVNISAQRRQRGRCPQSAVPFRTADGTCNNLQIPPLGSFEQLQQRLIDANYADGTDALDDQNRPSAREVSNAICDQGNTPPGNLKQSSLMLIYFGQFLDHDITLIDFNPEEELNISVPEDDPVFDEDLEFLRSRFVRGRNGEREFQNLNTAWVDLSNIYGDFEERNRALRNLDGTGTMKTSQFFGQEFLPLNRNVGIPTAEDDEGADPEVLEELERGNRRRENGRGVGRSRRNNNQGGNENPNNVTPFACGDQRCNENPMLLAYTTLFVREHNRLAREFRENNPNAGEERIYQEARARNILQYQSIVYDEYLPILLGTKTFESLSGPFRGVQNNVDPSVSPFFSTAAYRYGHSGIADLQFEANANGVITGTQELADIFFNPGALLQNSQTMDRLMNGARVVEHEQLDVHIVDALRNNLFLSLGEPMDLASLNIQRGRDHGLGTFNEYRAAVGLEPFRNCDVNDCFLELTDDPILAADLSDIYNGDFDELDVFVGGLAEKDLGDSQLGETFTTVIADQFVRMRDADRFFFENVQNRFPDVQIPATLDQIIDRNSPNSLNNGQPAFLTSSLYVSQITDSLIQVEWTDRDEDGNVIDGVAAYNLAVTVNGASQSVQLDANDRLFDIENLQPNTDVTVTLDALTRNGPGAPVGAVSVGEVSVTTASGNRRRFKS